MKTILRVLVGSRAHGLADDTSDFDYRGVFVVPTSQILSLKGSQQHTSWAEGDKAGGGKVEDDTAWEVGHFLRLATHSNPSILEVFAAPVEEFSLKWGPWLRSLLPCVWTPQGVKDAFLGYSVNQRKKMLDNKDGRSAKYACAYLRVLIQASVLLRTGLMPVSLVIEGRSVGDPLGPDRYVLNLERSRDVVDVLRRWRTGDFTPGEVIDTAEFVAERVRERAAKSTQVQDLAPVEAFLLDIRKAHLE